jgi:hypothetical protein
MTTHREAVEAASTMYTCGSGWERAIRVCPTYVPPSAPGATTQSGSGALLVSCKPVVRSIPVLTSATTESLATAADQDQRIMTTAAMFEET